MSHTRKSTPNASANLDEAIRRAESGGRFSFEGALWLSENAGLHELGRLASIRRGTLHGKRATYIRNLHINVTNICVNHCRFCAYRRSPGENGAFAWSPEKVWEFAEKTAPEGVREFHVVGALNPDLSLDYYEKTLRGLRDRFPGVHLKGFTAVEVAFLAEQSGRDVEHVLSRLIVAGLNSLTGGGAETLCGRVRREICPEKLDGEGYLDVHRRAHRLGLRSTATLLFGHVETPRERLEHLFRLRDLQDETGGFTAFVPLVFHPENTALAHLPRASARTVLETVALSRLVLDNIPHIKAYWVSLGPKLAQVALVWGADDLDGTIVRENIHHSAGAESPQGFSPEELRRLIREAGFRPVERDGVWSGLDGPEAGDEESPERKPPRFGSSLQALSWERYMASRRGETVPPDGVISGRERLTADMAEALLREGDLPELGRAAHAVRLRFHPDPIVTYNVDRNINTTNACGSLCDFCAFARAPEAPDAWIMDRETIAAKIEELYDVSRFESCEEIGVRRQETGVRIQNSEFRSQNSEDRNQNSGVRIQKSEDVVTEGSRTPETRNPKSETRNPKPETRTAKPETRNSKPKTRNPPPQILLQGGLHPDLDLKWYEDLFRWMRERWPDLHIHALSPPEIHYFSQRAGLNWREALRRLRAAGLDSVPGGGAEILSDRLRSSLSPRKCAAADWIGVMRAAHQEGLRTTATMVIGLGETAAERVEHLERLRALQDETSGFTAFILWTFQPSNTELERRAREEGSEDGVFLGAGACEYLRTLAVARLFLDNFENVQASWVTQGRHIAQLALLFGANDLGSTMLEENVVAAAGARFRLSPDELKQIVRDLGMSPVRRDFFYRAYARNEE